MLHTDPVDRRESRMNALGPMRGRDDRPMNTVSMDDTARSPDNDDFLGRIAVGVSAVSGVAVIVQVSIIIWVVIGVRVDHTEE
jgi:hypothetical protein